MSDTLIYDMSMMTESSPSIFVKKDFLNLQDQMNGNYAGNQAVIDTSALANSNKYMAYREAYLAVPLVLSMVWGGTSAKDLSGSTFAVGLKNNFASLIHSMVLDYAGTTIIQQTPMCQMFQNFTLMTTLSLQDVLLNGPTIGFYPDDAAGCRISGSTGAVITSNNNNGVAESPIVGSDLLLGMSNNGLLQRQKCFALNAAVTASPANQVSGLAESYRSMLVSSSTGLVYQIHAIIRLRDIHPFFNQVPLLKGVFFRLTLNLNQTQASVNIKTTGEAPTTVSVNAPLGGVSMLMVANATSPESNQGQAVPSGSSQLESGTYRLALAVGNKVTDQASASVLGGNTNTNLNQSIFMYVPAYTFAPSYEEAYLASPSKNIVYTDIFQYTTAEATSNFNYLITNGIANIKSCLILPFFSETATGGIIPYQSPLDPAGCGPTSPECHIDNFNVVLAGQNMIYNTQRYTFEQYVNQLQGVNSVNANLINGLTSSLVNQKDFEREYCYYYVNCSRGLPIDEAVPKSLMIQGKNMNKNAVKFVVFIEYGVQVSVDVLTGSRI